MTQERLNAYGMMSIEKIYIYEIPDFIKLIIEKFISQKKKRVDFAYKKMNFVRHNYVLLYLCLHSQSISKYKILYSFHLNNKGSLKNYFLGCFFS